MKKIDRKKQNLSKYSQHIKHIDSLVKNGNYQEIADDYKDSSSNNYHTQKNDNITGGAASLQNFNNYKPVKYERAKYDNNPNAKPTSYTGRYKLHKPSEIGDRLKFEIAKISGHPQYPLATEFAHNSLNWLKDINNTPNSMLINTISEITDTKLRAFIQGSVQKVLNRQNCRGVVYTPESEVAKKVQNSKEFKEIIYRNKNELLKNQVIKLKPITFYNDIDLKNAIHNATIYKAWLDKDGNLNAVVYDIYDFDKFKNRNDVVAQINNQMENWQENNNIENYFVLIFVKINRNK